MPRSCGPRRVPGWPCVALLLAACWPLLHNRHRAGAATLSSAALTGSSRPSDGYSALCVVGKNENRYVREWVEYHKCLGFSRVYLYDHNSTVPMSRDLADHIASGFVSYTNFSAAHRKFTDGYTSDLDRFMATVQGQAYKDCVERFGSRHTFLGFIDMDEFLVVYDETVRNVDELLRGYEDYPGLSVYWVVLGSSGHVERPAGRVVDSYTACTPHNHKFNTQFKTFANTRFRPTMYSPHRAVFAAPADIATGLEPYMVDERFNRIQRGRNKNSTHLRAAVFHYVTKSLADFTEKMRRGGGAGVTRPKYYFDLTDRYSKATCDGAIKTRRRFCELAAGSGGGGSASSATAATTGGGRGAAGASGRGVGAGGGGNERSGGRGRGDGIGRR